MNTTCVRMFVYWYVLRWRDVATALVYSLALSSYSTNKDTSTRGTLDHIAPAR